MSDQAGTPGVRISDLAVSFIRTFAPIAVGSALTWVSTTWHIVLKPSTSAQVAIWATAGVTASYYATARYLEHVKGSRLWQRGARWLGRWMLGGVLRRPVYAAPDERVKVLAADSGATRRVA